MNNIHGDVRAAAYFDRLGDRFEHAAALGAHVRRVDAAVARSDFAHGDQRVGVDPRSGRAAQRTGYAERALPHGEVDLGLHLLQFLGGWRTGLLTTYVGPYLARSHVGADIGRDTLF